MNHLTLNDVALHIESDGELRVAVKDLDGRWHEGYVKRENGELVASFVRQWVQEPRS